MKKLILVGLLGAIAGGIVTHYVTTNNIRRDLAITEFRDTETGVVVTINIEGQENYYIWDNERLEGLAQ